MRHVMLVPHCCKHDSAAFSVCGTYCIDTADHKPWLACRLMDVVMRFIDVVGSYDMPPNARERAEKARSQSEETQKAKAEEALQRRRQERKVRFAMMLFGPAG
jgi:hypothetical protein